jgi:hypothetical protein
MTAPRSTPPLARPSAPPPPPPPLGRAIARRCRHRARARAQEGSRAGALLRRMVVLLTARRVDAGTGLGAYGVWASVGRKEWGKRAIADPFSLVLPPKDRPARGDAAILSSLKPSDWRPAGWSVRALSGARARATGAIWGGAEKEESLPLSRPPETRSPGGARNSLFAALQYQRGRCFCDGGDPRRGLEGGGGGGGKVARGWHCAPGVYLGARARRRRRRRRRFGRRHRQTGGAAASSLSQQSLFVVVVPCWSISQRGAPTGNTRDCGLAQGLSPSAPSRARRQRAPAAADARGPGGTFAPTNPLARGEAGLASLTRRPPSSSKTIIHH